ncbi:MAG: DUF302 domain-containing protein [Nocardioides sp.]
MSFTMTRTLTNSYDETVAMVRQALADNGFGVLTEIDVKATLKTKIDVDVLPQIILGACRPPLAHAAMQAAPSIAALLPCNVVVRSTGDGSTVVEAIDPKAMIEMGVQGLEGGDHPALAEVANDAHARISAALDSLGGN